MRTNVVIDSFIGIGATSIESNLPECEKDVEVCGDVAEDVGYSSEVIAQKVVTLNEVDKMAKSALGSRRCKLLYSGHGTTIKGKFALWFGNIDNVVLWKDFVGTILAPLSKSCGHVTIALDTCFSGSSIREQAAEEEEVAEIGFKNQTTKGFGEMNTVPSIDLVDSPEHLKLDNLAIVTACGRKEFADAQWVSMTEGGWATHTTNGMSLFSRCWCNQILLAENIEYAAKYNYDYRKLKGKARTVRQIATATEAMLRGMYTHFGGPLYQGIPPRSDGPNVMVRVGPKHDGNLFGDV